MNAICSRAFPAAAKRTRGFSLIELMVALIAGLIVLGATVAFTVSMLRSHTENILATRLSQELRTAMALITRELRRAGYNDLAGLTVGQGTEVLSPFSQMTIENECAIFAYDSAGGTPGEIDPGEVKGLRRTVTNGVGVVQYSPGGAVQPTCDGAGVWEDITDTASVDVTLLSFELDALPAGGEESPGQVPIYVRHVIVQLAGTIRGTPDVERALYSRIRVRSDCIRADLEDCLLAPGVAAAP